ncbi:hypothetical protein NL676_037317 [Syzygium grande]|nr:hypothetical protein NL676_037317 [Syzygium grande]
MKKAGGGRKGHSGNCGPNSSRSIQSCLARFSVGTKSSRVKKRSALVIFPSRFDSLIPPWNQRISRHLHPPPPPPPRHLHQLAFLSPYQPRQHPSSSSAFECAPFHAHPPSVRFGRPHCQALPAVPFVL